MNINKFVPPIFFDLFKRKQAVNNIYKVGVYDLDTPPHFGNINFQEKFKLYDRFLPLLSKHVDTEKLIIDVGANIGDTTIAMLQTCKNIFLAIEASDLFFGYLNSNVAKLPKKDSSRVAMVKNLIGTGSIKGELNYKEWGTATLDLKETSSTQTHVSLDSIVEDKKNVVLIKVDTDGYDFDVLMSSESIILEAEPILFWENEISEDFQMQGYEKLYEMLKEKKYKYVFLFDNFGNLMLEEVNYSTLKSINDYVYSMKKHNCTRTIYYTDVLACTEKHISIVRNAIEDYKKNWILS